MTWARSPPVRSWDSSWGKSGLSELPIEQVQVSNQLLMFTLQLCVVVHETNSISPSGTLSRCWTWASAVVTFMHKLLGVAVVKVDSDQFGSRYSNPTRAETPRERGGVPFCLKNHCTSPYPPKLASLFASLVRKSLELSKSAVDGG